MNSGYCIYFNERRLSIVQNQEESLMEEANHPGICHIYYSGIESIQEALLKMEDESVTEVFLISFNMDECLHYIKNFFQYIVAGGGLVKNEKNEYLFIFRRGKWDLPKGKLDEMESIEDCATREVSEETGLNNVTLLGHLCDTLHVYTEKGNKILKESVWFNMEANSNQQLTPQTEEDILDIIWLHPTAWNKVLENTFPSVKDVLLQSGQLQAS